MHKEPTGQTIQQLQQAGHSLREISRLLGLSRNSVRKLFRQKQGKSAELIPTKHEEYVPLIKMLIPECRGNLVRVHERLVAEYQATFAYSTLTWLVRKYQLGLPPQRVGVYEFEPGQEMQHDTSPHQVFLGGQWVKAQCASLILAFSRQLFIQYYPCFTRFEAKFFLQQALSFMQGSCGRMIIDNTSVILSGGAGQFAKIAQDMQFFSRFYGFEFIAHAVNNPNRKGRIERPFSYAENNFLAGRTFSDWEDLNHQARAWCETVANQKPKRCLGMVAPQIIYIQEKPYLQPLPAVALPIYEHQQRIVDTQGYVNWNSNRYSVPESHIGHTVDVYQYLDKLEIYYQHRLIAGHERLLGVQHQRSIQKGHHVLLHRRESRMAQCEAEKQLTGIDALLDDYLTSMKSQVRGRGGWAFRRLLHLQRLYPKEPFLMAIRQAKQYGLYDLVRLEKLIIRCVAGEFFNLSNEESHRC